MKLSLANECQYLLISKSSTRHLQEAMKDGVIDSTVPCNAGETDEFLEQFRANFVVDGLKPFEEDHWRQVDIGSVSFKVGTKTVCR